MVENLTYRVNEGEVLFSLPCCEALFSDTWRKMCKNLLCASPFNSDALLHFRETFSESFSVMYWPCLASYICCIFMWCVCVIRERGGFIYPLRRKISVIFTKKFHVPVLNFLPPLQIYSLTAHTICMTCCWKGKIMELSLSLFLTVQRNFYRRCLTF